MSESPIWVSFTDRLAAALDEAAASRSEAERQEALLKVAFSEMVNAIGGPVAKAEHEARGSVVYRAHVQSACDARTKANMDAATVKGMEHRLDAWRTAESTRRSEMMLK